MALLASLSPAARAYDIDVHFYQTYSMARYAGLKHEAAALIAAAAQWPDETAVVASPFWDFKSRRLFHFPCFAKGIALDGNRMGEKTDKDEPVDKAMAEHTQICETEGDHPMAYLLMYEGLCRDCTARTPDDGVKPWDPKSPDPLKGDLLKAATALHTIEDSFAHEGTPSEVGHAAYGHWPDRAYNPDGSVEKFYKMVGSAMYAIVALRETLGGPGGKYCDSSIRDTNRITGLNPAVPNCQRSATELALGYRNLAPVKRTVERYILTDPTYVESVVNWALQKMRDVGSSETSGRLQFWMNPSFEPSAWLYSQADLVALMRSGKADVYAVMRKAFPRLYQMNAAATPDSWWNRGGHGTFKGYVISKYQLLANLYWLNTPNPEIKRLDDQIHAEDRDIRRLYKAERKAAGNPWPFNPSARLRARMSARDRLQASREALRLSLVEGFERDYLKDPTNSMERLMNDMVDTMLNTNVPRPLNASHRFEYENDAAYPRILEMELRITRVREMIQELYGTNVRFVANKVDWVFNKYQREHPDQTRDFTDSPAWLKNIIPTTLKGPEALVTFNYQQINVWNEQMIRFTFPLASTLFARAGETLVESVLDGFVLEGAEIKVPAHGQADPLAPPFPLAPTEGGGKIKLKLSLGAIAHLAAPIIKNGIRESWILMEKDYIKSHLVSPIELTGKIKNYGILKGLVDSREFFFSQQHYGFLDRVDGPGRSYIKDPNPASVGLLKHAASAPAPVRRLP